VHVAPSGPVYPKLHEQLVTSVEPSLGVKLLLGHTRHVALYILAVPDEYLPRAQEEHAALPLTDL